MDIIWILYGYYMDHKCPASTVAAHSVLHLVAVASPSGRSARSGFAPHDSDAADFRGGKGAAGALQSVTHVEKCPVIG